MKKSAVGTVAQNRYDELGKILAKARRDIEAEIQDHLRKGKEATPDKTQTGSDPSDAAGAEYHFAMAEAKAIGRRRIEEAQKRLEAGTYGYCFDCEEEISERRLRAELMAVRCKGCEEEREKKDGRKKPTSIGATYLTNR